jgi:hypothetical protein
MRTLRYSLVAAASLVVLPFQPYNWGQVLH